MKLNKLICPNCNAQLNIKLENGEEEIFCPYCGQKFLIDDEEKMINININKSTVDEAKIIREKNKEKEDKRNFVVLIITFLISILTLAIIWGGPQINKIVAEKEGKISAGSYIELIGKDYKSVEAHLKAAGFTNIELIDFKLEFGKTSDGTIVLADEISPDTCRFWDSVTHEKLDKDRFRRNMGGEEDAYKEIMKRLLGE